MRFTRRTISSFWRNGQEVITVFLNRILPPKSTRASRWLAIWVSHGGYSNMCQTWFRNSISYFFTIFGSKMEDWITVDGSFVTFIGQGRIFVREMRLVPGNELESAAHSRQESAVMTAKNSSNRFVNTKFYLFNLLFRRVIKCCSH